MPSAVGSWRPTCLQSGPSCATHGATTTGFPQLFLESCAACRSRCARHPDQAYRNRGTPEGAPYESDRRAPFYRTVGHPFKGAEEPLMFVTKKALSRRTMLRGMGATLALPLLDAMVPALTATVKTAGAPTRRFGAIFVPMGERPSHWTPSTRGVGFEFSPILTPIESFR